MSIFIRGSWRRCFWMDRLSVRHMMRPGAGISDRLVVDLQFVNRKRFPYFCEFSLD